MSLFEELKRRNVFRVGIAYAVAAWVLLQVLDVVAPLLELPDSASKLVLVLLALGLLPTLIFAWAFEMTPEGIKRERDVDRSESVTHHTAKKLDQVTIGLLVLVIALVILDRSFAPSGDAPASTDISDKTIAVLAFEDLSQDRDQVYFAEGLSEELLNLLAQVPDLQVAGRTSSFAFKGQQRDLREIGEILNVAHVLEGSVRKSGNRIRVTAQLINTADGFHLFSQTYDDELSDIFRVQDDIARQITDALKAELIGDDALDESAVTDPRVYELYLEARQKIHTRDGLAMAEASEQLDTALIIDPEYPPALAQKALVLMMLSNGPGFYGDAPMVEAFAEAKKLFDKALALDPELAEAHAGLGLLTAQGVDENRSALSHLRRAVEINPNLESANMWLATKLGNSGQPEEELALLEKLVARDPLFAPAFANLGIQYVKRRQFDRAQALIDRFGRAGGSLAQTMHLRALLAIAEGRFAEAVRFFERGIAADSSSLNMRNQFGSLLRALGNYDAMRALDMQHLQAYYELFTQGTYDPVPVETAYPPGLNTAFLEFHAYAYGLTGNYQKTVDVVEKDYGGLDALLENHSLVEEDDGIGYMGSVAYAYRELGREAEFTKIMTAIRAALDAQEQRPVFQLDFWYGEGTYAALRGDVPALRLAYEKIVDLNEVDIDPTRDLIMRHYADEPTLQPYFNTVRARAEAARAELGWGPYQSPGFDEYRETRPSGPQ